MSRGHLFHHLCFYELLPVLFGVKYSGTSLYRRSVCCGHRYSRSLSPAESGGPFIDQVYVLQGYAEGWKEGAWEEKIDSRPCIEPPLYSQDKHEYYRYHRVRGLRLV